MRRSVRTLASEWTAQHAVHMAKDVVSGWVVKVCLPVFNAYCYLIIVETVAMNYLKSQCCFHCKAFFSLYCAYP